MASISDLNLADKPEKFKFKVSKSNVCQGSVVTFNCAADGKPPVDAYQLLENGVSVSNGGNSLGMWSRNMSTGGEFHYTCMANNAAGTAYGMSSTVTVNSKQQIICREFFDIMLCMGSSISYSLFVFFNEMKYAF